MDLRLESMVLAAGLTGANRSEVVYLCNFEVAMEEALERLDVCLFPLVAQTVGAARRWRRWGQRQAQRLRRGKDPSELHNDRVLGFVVHKTSPPGHQVASSPRQPAAPPHQLALSELVIAA